MAQNLWAKVDKAGPAAKHRPDLGRCWLWTGALNSKLWLVHRWAWVDLHGPVPEGLELDHFACDRPECVNPAHVRPVTHAANLARGQGPSAVHGRKTKCDYDHPFDDANTRHYRGERVCIACVRRRNAARRK